MPAPVSERPPPAKQAAPVAAAKPAPGAAAKAAPVTTPVPAKPAPGAPESRPEFYTVRAGDTLYSIALNHGLDHRDLAIWNGIDNRGTVRVGQQLRVTPPPGAAVAAPFKAAPGALQAKPLTGAQPPAPQAAGGGALITEPKGVRLPYSEQALAQLQQPAGAATSGAGDPPRAESRPGPVGDSARGPDDLDWSWPVRGKIVGTFNDTTSKGIAIAGKLGQPVLASAPGRVIFSGTGIRGFGKLIVIKHNNTYLSVYAHNNELLVKEGQNVTKGQKIAEMGNSDADQVKLHFEIRRFGKPIDPMKFLPSPA